jgi:hypothetical protein
VMAARYKQTIQELTGRKVLAFLSQAHVEPDITMEIFFVDGPLDGFGSVEITGDVSLDKPNSLLCAPGMVGRFNGPLRSFPAPHAGND